MWGRAGCWGCCHLGARDEAQMICLHCVLCCPAPVYSRCALPVAPSPWLCWGQSCRGQSPQRCQWWKSRATTVRSHGVTHSDAQPHASPPLLVAGESPTLAGHSTAAKPGGHSQGTRSHLHMCPLCTKARFASSRPAEDDSTRGTEVRQEQPAPTCHRQILSKFWPALVAKLCQKKQKDLGVSRTGDTAPDTIPSWEQRECRGSGTCQAVCKGHSPSLIHWGSQGWGRDAAR